MKRLSLLLVASAFLMTASGCCCGLFHGCNSCGYPSSPCGCGYQAYPAYPVSPGCSTCPTCPTCPSGGCGVNGPVYQQGAFYEGPDSMSRAALTSNVGYGATPAESLASAQRLPTY
jgi:hypothetical protein